MPDHTFFENCGTLEEFPRIIGAEVFLLMLFSNSEFFQLQPIYHEYSAQNPWFPLLNSRVSTRRNRRSSKTGHDGSGIPAEPSTMSVYQYFSGISLGTNPIWTDLSTLFRSIHWLKSPLMPLRSRRCSRVWGRRPWLVCSKNDLSKKFKNDYKPCESTYNGL